MAAKHLVLLDAAPELPFTLHLRFADGACMRVDVSGLIEAHPAVFEALKDPSTFMRAQTGLGVASAVGWWGPDDRLRFYAYKLRAEAIHQATGRGPVVVRAWMERHQLTVAAAAKALGVVRGSVRNYLSAKNPVPRKVVLAIAGWSNRQQPDGQAPDCTPDALRQWLARWGYTYSTGALALGVSRRMLAYYLSGKKPVPRRVALAMGGWRG